MNKIIGSIIFFLAIGVFTVYMLNVYIPAIQVNPSDSEALLQALYWGIGCGIAGTIGAIIAKGIR